MYYGPGRVIIKQDHPAYALYFILSGEVAVSQESYDPILNEMVTQSVGVMVAGEMFGEVSLLHNIPRTATITTISKFQFFGKSLIIICGYNEMTTMLSLMIIKSCNI